jgi:NTP pyrophosphatase (non-canonical NTP hydrolase)
MNIKRTEFHPFDVAQGRHQLRHQNTAWDGIVRRKNLFQSLMDISNIQKRLDDFARQRNWNQFHSPKNLSMALAAEAAELLEIFQWLTDEQSREIVNNEKEMSLVKEEIADVFIYLIRLTDKLNVDIEKVVLEKIVLNEKKYPVELAKDNAEKYSRRE